MSTVADMMCRVDKCPCSLDIDYHIDTPFSGMSKFRICKQEGTCVCVYHNIINCFYQCLCFTTIGSATRIHFLTIW